MGRATLAIVLLLGGPLLGAQPARDTRFPLWDGKETIADYAKRAHVAPALTLDLGDGVKWEGVLVPAGTFVMGSPAGEARTEQESLLEKQHRVTISRPFYMGKYELTQAQFEKIMGANPSRSPGGNLPVHNLPWQSAQSFCDTAAARAGRPVQLPTDAQWEYACRAGTTTAYSSGNDIADLDRVGWHGGNSGGGLHNVGELKPNAWGLYDMHGNIREFVRDYFDGKPPEDATDPPGPADGDPNNHVVRGGAYTANAAFARNCRAAVRRPTEALAITGFRIMVPLP